jgi:hydroxymethylglutaryl-CoA lyase
VTDCPYDGPTPPASVAKVAKALNEMGCYAVSLGDTIGHAIPQTTARMLDAVLSDVPAPQLAGHFHDTKGQALANIETSLRYGIRTFDASVAGLGGCPYAPGGKGNVASESVVALLHGMGFVTGIDEGRLAVAAVLPRV